MCLPRIAWTFSWSECDFDVFVWFIRLPVKYTSPLLSQLSIFNFICYLFIHITTRTTVADIWRSTLTIHPELSTYLLRLHVDAVTLAELMLTAQLAASRVHAVTLAELTLAACCLLLLQPACSCCLLCYLLPASLHLSKVIKPNAHFFSWEQWLTGYFS